MAVSVFPAGPVRDFMRCATCSAEMIPLLLSYVCDPCESRRMSGDFFRGYVVWTGPEWGKATYVFRTRTDAAKYRVHTDQRHHPIRTVLSLTPFRWRQSAGSLKDLEMADRLYEIHPDARHEPGPNRAFVDR